MADSSRAASGNKPESWPATAFLCGQASYDTFWSNSLKYDTSLPCLDSGAGVPYLQHKNQTLHRPMNTFSHLSVFCPNLPYGGGFAQDGVMGLPQPFIGALSPVA